MTDLLVVEQAIERLTARAAIMARMAQDETLLRPEIDYGIIPGTDKKPTLLKPGAERLCAAFALAPVFINAGHIEDWDKPLFHYHYQVNLMDMQTGVLLATGLGSCNSMESKYGFRSAGRLCPNCGKEIRKSKPPKTGWYCWTKTEGCGAEFKENDPAIVNQVVGKVPNDDIFSLVNTLDKMAQKRALIAAVLIGTGASAYFTQDIEDLPGFENVVIAPEPQAPVIRPAKTEEPTKSEGENTSPFVVPVFANNRAPLAPKVLTDELLALSKELGEKTPGWKRMLDKTNKEDERLATELSALGWKTEDRHAFLEAVFGVGSYSALLVCQGAALKTWAKNNVATARKEFDAWVEQNAFNSLGAAS
jgi:hypothetical protein